jgi:hypothetical protein
MTSSVSASSILNLLITSEYSPIAMQVAICAYWSYIQALRLKHRILFDPADSQLVDHLPNDIRDMFSMHAAGSKAVICNAELSYSYFTRGRDFINKYRYYEIRNLSKLQVSHIFTIIQNTCVCLYTTTSDRPNFDVYLSFAVLNKAPKRIRMFSELSGVYLHIPTQTIGVSFVDGRFVEDCRDDHRLLLYVSSYTLLFATFFAHNWVHFHFPDLVCYNVSRIITDPSSLLGSLLEPYTANIALTNAYGLSIVQGLGRINFFFPDHQPFTNGLGESVYERTLDFYKTFTLKKLFTMQNKCSMRFIETHEQLYAQICKFCRAVFARMTGNEKDEWRQVFISVASNLDGLHGCAASDMNIVCLLSRFMYQVSFIHAIDHLTLCKTLTDVETVLYFTDPYSQYTPQALDFIRAQSLIQNVAYNDYFKTTMQSHVFSNPFIQKEFLKLKKRLSSLSMFGHHLSEITMSISY